MGTRAADNAGPLRRWGGGGRRRGETKTSVKRVSGEDLKAKITQTPGCIGVSGVGL